jgi:hypothetical protein
MSDPHEAEMARVLDECVELLLSGGDWEAHLPADAAARAELLDLMQIAEQLVDSLPSEVESEPASARPRRLPRALWDEFRDSVQRSQLRLRAGLSVAVLSSS